MMFTFFQGYCANKYFRKAPDLRNDLTENEKM